MTCPGLPNLPVLPNLCTKSKTLLAQLNYITNIGKSKCIPLFKASVHTNTL